VRTFIAGDVVADAAAALRVRIKGLAIPDEYAHQHVRGREIGVSLGFILDAIDTLVLPIDPREAFDLLVLFFKADSQFSTCDVARLVNTSWRVDETYVRVQGK
jgi:hypothetical protein